MPFNPNTCSPDTFVFDPPLPDFSSKSFIASEKPSIISTTSLTSPTQDFQNVLPRRLSTCLGLCHGLSPSSSSSGSPTDADVRHGSGQPSVDALIRQDLLNFDNWLLETTTSSPTPSTSTLDASSIVNGTATPACTASEDGTGFDQLLSPLYNDASSTSAFNTPWTPYLDTPDPSPFQTPLFGYSNSEDSMRLDQLLMPQDVAAAVSLTSSNDLLADVSAATTTPTFQDASTDSRLQAEPSSLLDFVLFDDLAALPAAASSPVSTTTTTTATPDSTEELALQLVAAAAANLASSAQSSTLFSPLSIDSPLGDMTSLFQESSPVAIETINKNNFDDVTLSGPLQMNLAATTVVPPATTSLDEFALTSLVLDHDFAVPLSLGAAATTIATLPAIAPYHPATHQVSLFNKSASVSTGVSMTQSCLKRKSNEEHVARALSSFAGAYSFGNNNNNNNNNNTLATPASSPTAGDASPRPFVCNLCGRAFSRLFNLNTHKITHDRVKARQFSCSEPGCKKAFTRKNDLQRHQISIHGVTHQFDCKDCKRPFARRDTLQRHLELSESCSKDQLDGLDAM